MRILTALLVLSLLAACRERKLPAEAAGEPGNGWTCIFEPHHVLRVQSDGQTVNVVICLECGDVSFVAREKQLILKSVRPDQAAR